MRRREGIEAPNGGEGMVNLAGNEMRGLGQSISTESIRKAWIGVTTQVGRS